MEHKIIKLRFHVQLHLKIARNCHNMKYLREKFDVCERVCVFLCVCMCMFPTQYHSIRFSLLLLFENYFALTTFFFVLFSFLFIFHFNSFSFICKEKKHTKTKKCKKKNKIKIGSLWIICRANILFMHPYEPKIISKTNKNLK